MKLGDLRLAIAALGVVVAALGAWWIGSKPPSTKLMQRGTTVGLIQRAGSVT
jgi:hypothetical protein